MIFNALKRKLKQNLKNLYCVKRNSVVEARTMYILNNIHEIIHFIFRYLLVIFFIYLFFLHDISMECEQVIC